MFEQLEVPVDGARELPDGGEVVEGLGEVFAARLEGARQAHLFGDDLLFEQRGQHDCADAGICERLGSVAPPG